MSDNIGSAAHAEALEQKVADILIAAKDFTWQIQARKVIAALAPQMMAEAWDQGQKSGMRHADRLLAAEKIGMPELVGKPSSNPYRKQTNAV